ncbi:hypothetical protein RJ639_037849 [Escallonia herrerae]|uniref:Dirigent protein n=1 Tax=Escallonia herrerae TaxID=1293975 RepID=A0AA88WLW9_9ASTE|nr:hypothetical protein RJ639_037849 [Escallonia herrerae]
MSRLGLVVMLIFLETTMLWAQSPEEGSSSWATRDDSGDEVVTNLRFYFHDTLGGRSPSAVRVAQASDTDKSPILFGALMMVDDPLTEGPDMNSKLVDRARGLYGSAGQTELGLIMAPNYGFTDGVYSGSSFSVLGINPAVQHVRELPIISGTGLFRMGRGHAIAQTYSFDLKTGDAVVGYNVTIVTYPCRWFSASTKAPKAVEEWFQNLSHRKEKLTKLHFYFHDIVSGKNPSAVHVAQANTTFTSPTLFGLVSMMDDALRVGPEPDSKIVGRAQGIYGSAGLEEFGKCNGSTLSVLGRNPVFHDCREMPIVGGSDVFRVARGVATAKTIWLNLTTGDAVVEYQVMVLHY